MNELKVVHVNNIGQFPVEVRKLISEASLKHIILGDGGLSIFLIGPHSEIEGQLRPLLLGKQMIGLGVIPRLYELDRLGMLEKGVRPFLFKEGFHVFEHGLT